jgi:uncharacterized protein YggE
MVYAEDTRRMAVQGEGSVSVAPDMASVTIGVSTFDKDASVAMAQNAAEMANVIDVVAAAGIDKEDMQTLQLSLNPRWENRSGSRENEVVGYEATNSVRLRVRKLDSLGDVIDAVAQVGANRIHGIQFGLLNPRPHLDAARKNAVLDAKVKAKLYAEAAGVELGDIMNISEPTTNTEPRGMMMAEMAMGRSSAPISEGELSLSATINVIFALE